jgi:predicted DNA-binding protein (UPF0251 family)
MVMPRPPKCRRVNFIPGITYFKPAGIPLRVLVEIRLTVEEVEAIRLKDLESLDQEQCAEKMNVSRPTFQRVLESARKKLADALLGGKAIRIEGGNFEMAPLHFTCPTGHEWEVPFEVAMKAIQQVCPVCKVPVIVPLQPSAFGWSRGRYGRRHGEENSRYSRTPRVK